MIRWLCSLFILFACAVVTSAGSIEDLVASALATSPEIAAAEAEIDAARAARQGADVRDNPEFSASLGGKSADDGDASDQGLAWSVAIDQPVNGRPRGGPLGFGPQAGGDEDLRPHVAGPGRPLFD